MFLFLICFYQKSLKMDNLHSIKISSNFVTVQSLSCVRLFETPMDGSTPGFPVLHHLPELAQTHVHSVGDASQPSHPLSSPSPPALKLSQHRSFFLMSQLFASGGQSIGASVSASVLPMNIQD